MKTIGPLLLGFIVGMIAMLQLFVPKLTTVRGELLDYAIVLAAAAYVLGAVNVIQVNYPKVRRRQTDWGYKLLLLISAGAMAAVGIPWTGTVNKPAGFSFQAAATGSGAVALRLDRVRSDAAYSLDGSKALPAWVGGKPVELPLAAGPHTLRVFMNVAGYGEAANELLVEGDAVSVMGGEPPRAMGAARSGVLSVGADLPMRWGKEGRVFVWFYDHVFFPCNATLFALLAFFIASAAFRAFRARNVEAALLLGAAILVMVGRVPMGRALSDVFPLISDWLVAVPNNAGRRAIMMGAALGAIATGLRIILGLERSHMGAD